MVEIGGGQERTLNGSPAQPSPAHPIQNLVQQGYVHIELCRLDVSLTYPQLTTD